MGVNDPYNYIEANSDGEERRTEDPEEMISKPFVGQQFNSDTNSKKRMSPVTHVMAKKRRTCSNCNQQAGHNARTCSLPRNISSKDKQVQHVSDESEEEVDEDTEGEEEVQEDTEDGSESE